jgi:hypothetical protein
MSVASRESGEKRLVRLLARETGAPARARRLRRQPASKRLEPE